MFFLADSDNGSIHSAAWFSKTLPNWFTLQSSLGQPARSDTADDHHMSGRIYHRG